MRWDEIATLLGMLLAVVVVLCLAYVFTRYLAGRSLGGLGSPRNGGRGGTIRLLERVPLGREQFLVVAQVGETCLLLGVTGESITLLCELSAGEAALWSETPQTAAEAPMRFQDALQEVLRQKKK